MTEQQKLRHKSKRRKKELRPESEWDLPNVVQSSTILKTDGVGVEIKNMVNAAIQSKDRPFDPSVEMMVNDYDDERTLEEEEALAAGESHDPHAELSSLQREGDMPLAELLALYGFVEDSPGCEVDTEAMKGVSESQGGAMSGDKKAVDSSHDADTVTSVAEVDRSSSTSQSEEEKPSAKTSALQQLYEPMSETTECEREASRSLRSVSRSHSEVDNEEEEDDYDYSPEEDEWKKTIMVGSDYQAGIPEGLCSYDDALPYENEDKLLWDPYPLSNKQTEDYLKHVADSAIPGSGVCALPTGSHLKDDEQALFLLLQCGHNVDEALRRRRINAVASADTMSLWSEDECRNFENGLRCYGKDFHLIQQNKVRTRSVGELVQFYYLWKKTERHDVFANKARLEKKKYTLHPGLTDFMDRFLEDQEGNNTRDRSSSPGIHNILHVDAKKQSHQLDINVASEL